MKREVKIISIVIIVGVCALLGVLTFNTLRENPPSPEEQVSIQEEEMECIGMYYPSGISISKIHDNQDNVTCWMAFSGISCIPDHMLSP